jgi:hypothetical protein
VLLVWAVSRCSGLLAGVARGCRFVLVSGQVMGKWRFQLVNVKGMKQ